MMSQNNFFRKYSRALLIHSICLCSSLLLSGCGVWNNLWITPEADLFAHETFVPSDTVRQASLFPASRAPQASSESTEGMQAIAPVEVSVAQAFFDSNDLNVKVHLKTLKEMDPQNIIVGVSGLKEGKLVEESYQRVSDVIATDTLDEDSLVALRFTLSSGDLSEYQVKCNWGPGVSIPTVTAHVETLLEVAQPLAQSEEEQLEVALESDALIIEPTEGITRASLSREIELGEELDFAGGEKKDDNIQVVESEREAIEQDDLRIQELDVENETILCSEPPCDIMYTVLAKLENKGTETVDSVQIAVGLYWANSGQLPKVPAPDAELQENEELIELSELNIASGKSKKVRVKLDRSVPDVPGGSFIPHVRLLK